MQDDDEAIVSRRKRIHFRSWHRGTQEADLLLGRFADRYLPTMDLDALDQFEAVLEVPEPDLLAWYLGQVSVPAAARSSILNLILNFKVYE
ncbi:MAG: succinate dehydrogenase assembly factor 2 [Alphaproteobacteria bacterium]|nr:succinate dehydrogenase assembly factor 2 [Alphaproteobacteria bacterium]